MHIGVQLQLVVAHREFGAFAAHAPDALGLPGQLQLDAFLQLGTVHRLCEIDIEHRLLQRRVGRVLVELRTRDLGDKGRRLEFWRVRIQANMRGDHRLIEPDFMLRADGPVFLGLEFQLLVVHPFPLALEGRRDPDAGRHFLADSGKHRHRLRKIHDQRTRVAILFIFVLDRRARRILHRELDLDRLRPRLPPFDAVEATGHYGGQQHHCDTGARGIRSCPSTTRRTPRNCASAHPARPGRRIPGDVTEYRRKHTSQQTCKTAPCLHGKVANDGDELHDFPF